MKIAIRLALALQLSCAGPPPKGEASPPIKTLQAPQSLVVPAASTSMVTSAPASAPASAPTVAFPGVPLDASWKQEVYVMTDSVVLGAKTQLTKGFTAAGWTVTIDGRPAIMLHIANKEMKLHKTLPEVAVVAVGYNTLWERNRRNFSKWSKRFDKQAEEIYTTLTERGVKKVVWVMLREISEKNIPIKNKSARNQLEKAGFYFPYVNERLKAMRERHPDMGLADWPTAGDAVGNTYDAIHLNPRGANIMTAEIMKTVGLEPPPPAPKKEKPAKKTKKK